MGMFEMGLDSRLSTKSANHGQVLNDLIANDTVRTQGKAENKRISNFKHKNTFQNNNR